METRNPNPITEKNIETISRLEKESMHNRTTSERVAERVTRVAGGVVFILVHALWFTGWIAGNTGLIPGLAPWDPFPFSFLTLVVSLEAIFLSLLVLMTQNRLTKDADKRAQLDLQINMLAEQESTASLKMLENICKHLGVQYETEAGRHLATHTDIDILAKKLDEKLTTD